MAEPQVIVHPPGQAARRSWLSAYYEFLRDPKQPRGIKLMPLALVGIVPVSIIDDFLLPIGGIVDDIPTTILVLLVAGLIWSRVRIYR